MHTKEHLNKKRTGKKNRYHVQHVYKLQIYTSGSTAGTQRVHSNKHQVRTSGKMQRNDRRQKRAQNDNDDDPIPRLRKAMDAKNRQ
jgi:hypothetical protein